MSAVASVLPVPMEPTRKLVLLVLSALVDATSEGIARPSVPELMEATGLARSTLLDHLAQLEAGGYIARDRQPGKRTGYTVLVPDRPAERTCPTGRTRPLPKTPIPTSKRLH
jgi:DNA-binding transcriptional ArsR family regulator